MPPPLPSACAWAQPSKLDMLCAAFLPSSYVVTSFPAFGACSELSSEGPSAPSVQAGCVRMTSSSPSEGTPAADWEETRAAHPCSRDGLIIKISKPVKNRIHRSLKYQKSALHFVPVIKSLCPKFSQKVFNEIFIFTMIFSLSLSLHRDTNCAIKIKSGTTQADVS